MSSKRYFPQEHGERKKAKLDVTISDHNFPLSQNPSINNGDNWGDDNDDEILLMASQACEQAYSNNNSTLPDFSLCMQPGATSTQMFPQPGPSKTQYNFIKPTTNSPQVTSIQLKDKCNRISSPLPGMSAKITSAVESMNYKDDLYSDRVYKGQDTDQIYRQFLQLQEENAKLKSENGKLLDKCVTKEGEASILRTQLKSCQVAVDSARMEKIRAQEKVQMEWSEKLTAVTGQLHDLRTQLDFKNLEIISVKEKCRMLESTKVKLTQVTVPNSDATSSHRLINSTYNPDTSQRRVKMASVAAQTDGKAHFLKLNIGHIPASSNLTVILPLILEPTSEQPSLLDYNENLQTDTDLSYRSRVFSTFRIPTTPSVSKHKANSKITIECIHQDLTCIANGVEVVEKFDKIVKATASVLTDVQHCLRAVCERAGATFQREMDERYVEAAGHYSCVSLRCLLAGRALYKEEQAILARRLVALLSYLLDPARRILPMEQVKVQMDYIKDGMIPIINDICNSLNAASCATLYSGLVSATCRLLARAPGAGGAGAGAALAASRARPPALGGVLRALRPATCAGGAPMRIDFEQGVLLYKKGSCPLHMLLKQIEMALKCIEKQNLVEDALSMTQHLLAFYSIQNARKNPEQGDNRCDCQLVLLQVMIFALRICSVMADDCKSACDSRRRLRAARRGGVLALHARAARDAEWAARLGPAEGAFQQLCERAAPDLHDTMLDELLATFQCPVEDTQQSYHKQAWVKSFENFSLAD